ncbi:MAG: hypothetical protein ACYCO0_02535 [Candidatus Micrarchaeaceae archaeon]
MPNNPGRIAGDYSIGEKEEVKYMDPGSFGAVREANRGSTIRIMKYLLPIGIAIVIALALVFSMIK